MADDGLSIEMLPARHGDGLWIEWGAPGAVHRMIIDGGTKSAFAHLRDKLDAIPAGSRKIDLLVVTHIDLDHIEAPIELIRTAALDIEFGDIWFNEEKHLVPGGTTADGAEQLQGTTRGGVQGEFLGALIARHSLPWNQQFAGGPIVVPPSGPLPVVELDGGLNLVLLSPTPDKLAALKPVWNKEVARKDLSPGDRARAIELLEERMGPVQPTRGEKEWGGDHSAANGSSIAFIAEYGDERWLLSGDAHVEVLVSGLKRYAEQFDLGSKKIALNGFKLPHHGSVNNMSDELLELVDVEKFLISSNGAYFKHPDARCVDLLIDKAPNAELAFNYLTTFTEAWADRPGVTYRYDTKHQELQPTAPAATDEDRAGEPGPTMVTAAPAVATPAEAPVAAPVPQPEPMPITPVEIRVYHGSLDRADSPVIVGHYAATPLSGAEGHIDGRFGGRLSDRHTRDLYPGPNGSHLFVEAPERSYPAGGVLVVGLGDYGELTPRALAETLRTALVAHALARADTETEADETVELQISSVIVGGTGEQGMGVRASTRAIVDGLVAANQSLLEKDRSPRCQYTRLDFWEQRAPEAELALVSLRPRPSDDEEETTVVDPDALPVGVAVDPVLRRAAGFLMHSLSDAGGERPWRRVVVTEPEVEGEEPDEQRHNLQFMVDRRLAAVGQDRHVVEKRPLERMLRKSMNRSDVSESLNTALFELLLPDELKWEMRSAADIQLVVDKVTAKIPWEMLAARSLRRGTREPLALRAPLTRQLADGELKRVERAEDMRALVIGNPPAGAAWPSLPGAVSEARAVIDTLAESGVDGIVDFVFDGQDSTAVEQIEAAIFGGFRVVHIAGHGAFDPDDPTRSGVVIGPDEYLSAQFLSKLRPVPDLVFLNCCHLGRLDGSLVNAANGRFNELGASVAQVLISAGVRAVVAAGWAVDDFAATAFATTFYDQMMRSEATFGEAVFAARQAARTAAPRSNTWGAYQCYGDSGLRLPAKETAEFLAPEPATVREMLRRIEYVIDRIESRGSDRLTVEERAEQEEELKILTHTAKRQDWFDGKHSADGGVLAEALGRAHSEIGNWDIAIEWYEHAVAHPSGGATLRAAEQLANIRDRYAISLTRNAAASADDLELAQELSAAAATGLEALSTLNPTSERSALFGGLYKRQAVASSDPARRIGSLERSADCYLAAYTDEQSSYTLLNYVQIETLRGRLAGQPSSRVDDDQLRQVGRFERARVRTSAADFWDMIGAADASLTRKLVDGALHRSVDRLADLYQAAFASRSTARQRASSVDHLRDLAALHDDAAEASALRRLVALLDPPVDELRAAADERAAAAATTPSRNGQNGAVRPPAGQRRLVDFVQLESVRALVADDEPRVSPEQLAEVTALTMDGHARAGANGGDTSGRENGSGATDSPATPGSAMTLAQAELALRLADGSVRRRLPKLKSLFAAACADGATDEELHAEADHLQALAEAHPDALQSKAIRGLVDTIEASTAD